MSPVYLMFSSCTDIIDAQIVFLYQPLTMGNLAVDDDLNNIFSGYLKLWKNENIETKKEKYQ